MRKSIGTKVRLTGGILCAALLLSACTGTGSMSQKESGANTGAVEMEAVDRYFENGVIYTVDENDTVAEAMAVRDGKIVFVGSAKEGEAYKSEAEEVVDLKGQMMLPGFTDAHIHMITEDFFDFTFDATMSLAEVEKLITDTIKAHPDQEAYYGFGFMKEMFEGEEASIGPRKERLDALCADKPVSILSFDGHMAWANTKALEAAGITKETKDIQGGTIYKDEKSGELWGILVENAVRLLPLKRFSDDEMKTIIQEYNTNLNAFGYTGILALQGNGFLEIPWETLGNLEEEGLLTMRTRGANMISNWESEKDLDRLKELVGTYTSPLLAATTAKFFVDGVVDYRTAYMLEPYEDVDSYGEAVWETDALGEAVKTVHEMGVQAHFHAIGDAAARMALDAVEYAKDETGSSDTRDVLTHLQYVSDEDIGRMGELDAVAVAQPFWHYKEPGYFEEVEVAAVGQRAEQEYPMRSLLDAGVTLAYSSDYPASPYPNPFHAIETSVTRNMPAGWLIELPDIKDMDDPAYLLNADERVSVADAIRGFTASAAYSTHTDDITGSLEVGKSADMIVIDQNLLEIHPLDISETTVLATYLEGRQVYEVS